MSHFIAAVITKDPDNYYEELAPYQEDSKQFFIKLFEKIMTDPEYQDYYIGFVNCHI